MLLTGKQPAGRESRFQAEVATRPPSSLRNSIGDTRMPNIVSPGQEFLAQCENISRRNRTVLNTVGAMLTEIDENIDKGINMTSEIHDLSALIAQVHHMEDVNAAATALIQGLSAKYAEAQRLSDWESVSRITETLRLSAGNLSDAITANTVATGVAPATVVVIDHGAQADAVAARVAADEARIALDVQPVVSPEAAAPVEAPAQEAPAAVAPSVETNPAPVEASVPVAPDAPAV